MKRGKVVKIRRIEYFISYLSSTSSVLSRGIHWVSWWSIKHQKSILSPKTPIRPDISGLLAGFQRLWLDMPSPLTRHVQPLSLIWLSSRVPLTLAGHVRPNPIPQRLSPEPDISDPQAGLQRGWSDMSGPRPGHVQVSDTPTTRFYWGAIKAPSRLYSTTGLGMAIRVRVPDTRRVSGPMGTGMETIFYPQVAPVPNPNRDGYRMGIFSHPRITWRVPDTLLPL
jgi:hypothetical protein